MKNLNLPTSTVVNRFIPKQTFINKIDNGKTIFSDIEKITWAYKLSSSTIKIDGTKQVEEIHIFNMILKSKDIPNKALNEIKKLIPYPILFILENNDNLCYAISLLNEKKYYISNWNEEKEFNFIDTNLEKVYQNIVKQFLTNLDTKISKTIDFNYSLELDNKIANLNKQIDMLKSKINKEKQYNKKTELNKELKKLKENLKMISGENV